MSTTPVPERVNEPTPLAGAGTKTLSVKNVPHAVWRRARQNALASNLGFGDYVVKLLGASAPFPPPYGPNGASPLGSSPTSTTGPSEPSGKVPTGLASTEDPK